MDTPQGTFDDLEAIAQPGDYIFFWNHDPIAYAIEKITQGPSHVIQLAHLHPSLKMFEFESVFPSGVRVLPLTHYADSKSRMLLCRRRGITDADVAVATVAALRELDRGYNWVEEVCIALHSVLPFIFIGASTKKLFCSGYVQLNFSETDVPFAAMPNENDTPEFLLKDKGTEAILWVN